MKLHVRGSERAWFRTGVWTAIEFDMQLPSTGFPARDYRVEFQVNGEPAGFREFRVAR
jgi:hypothetical protein